MQPVHLLCITDYFLIYFYVFCIILTIDKIAIPFFYFVSILYDLLG